MNAAFESPDFISHGVSSFSNINIYSHKRKVVTEFVCELSEVIGISGSEGGRFKAAVWTGQ